jgi:hypothetical protein
VVLTDSVFADKAVIVGRVYVDRNNNDSYEDGVDQGIAGARVYLSNGRYAVTDAKGRYSLTDVEPGIQAVRLDPLTVGYRVKGVPDDQGQRGTRYVNIRGAGIHNEDFLINLPVAEIAKVRSTWVRMGGVTLEKVVTQVAGGYQISLTLSVASAVQNLIITDPLPSGATRSGVQGQGISVSGNQIAVAGVVQPGTYRYSYTLTSNLPLDQVTTDPDLFWDEVTR